MKKIEIFDTSLRDGAQTAGVNMNWQNKKDIWLKLAEFWIDKIEVWFAAASPWDFESIKYIWENVSSQIYSLARSNIKDIDVAYESLRNSTNRWIHIFIWTSPMHREYKLNMTKKEILDSISKHVEYARNKFKNDTDSIMFSPEDGMRTEHDFLFEAINIAIKNWANEINLPDTVWFAQNIEIYELTKELINEFWKEAKFSIHTHNDLWQAVSNSLAFIKVWWTIIQWTIPPAYWERAWNADLIQIMMNIIKRPDYFWVKLWDKINIKKTYEMVNYIANKIWKRIPENYPVLGRDVYSHSSWIHQDWANKHKSTYEIIQPEEIGYRIEHSFILTNQSGRAWLENAIKSYFWLGLDKEDIDIIFEKFKEITSTWDSIIVTMDDIRSILKYCWVDIKRNIKIWDYSINLDNNNKSRAAVKLYVNWNEKYFLATWVWAVDAIYKAIIKASWIKNIYLLDFSIQALTSDPSAAAKVSIVIERDWKIYEEFWVNQDIVRASIQAFTNCIDRMI